MHWIIQNNLYHEHGFQALLDTLERFTIPHDVVRVVPFSDDLPDDQQIIPPVAPTGLVMVCGSFRLANIAAKRGWVPGSFWNGNHDYRVWRQHYQGKLLNDDAKVCRFAEVEPIWSPFFIRPCDDGKAFSGMVTDWPEFSEWRRKVVELHETYTTLNADTVVCYAPIRAIRKEFRFFVVDDEIVGQSLYKLGSRVIHDPLVDDAAIGFARECIAQWQPARAYALDVAMTDEGMRVVEINCINAAGFYAIDVVRFVMAIEAMAF